MASVARDDLKVVRAFFAIEIPPSIRTLIEDQIEILKDHLPPGMIRWVRPEGIHLTLKFLGDVEPEILDEVNVVMQRTASGCDPFLLRIGRLGCFPNLRRPRILWVGVEERSGALSQLHSALERELEPIGFEREGRPFHPHLTLGRMKRRAGSAEAERISEALASMKEEPLGEVEVKELHLMRSDLKPTGAVYTKLSVVKLGKMG